MADPDAANDPAGPEAGGSTSDLDALRRLEARLERAAERAERLLTDAAASALRAADRPGPAGPDAPGGEGADGPSAAPADGVAAGDAAEREIPAAGWQRPESPGDRGGGELELLLSILGSVRDRIPPELQQRLADAVREVLLALRALIDWYLERTERRRSKPQTVEDIPIL